MKGSICTVIGAIGGGIAALFGGWDSALVTLIIFMGIDFATGMITGAMGKSKHSKTGKLNSKAGWYGLAKKGSILMLIIVAVRLDTARKKSCRIRLRLLPMKASRLRSLWTGRNTAEN